MITHCSKCKGVLDKNMDCVYCNCIRNLVEFVDREIFDDLGMFIPSFAIGEWQRFIPGPRTIGQIQTISLCSINDNGQPRQVSDNPNDKAYFRVTLNDHEFVTDGGYYAQLLTELDGKIRLPRLQLELTTVDLEEIKIQTERRFQ